LTPAAAAHHDPEVTGVWGDGGSRAAAGTPGVRDVARLAGVSPMTVSRVINSHPKVSEVTRHRVLDAIRELGYRPSRAARDLSRGRSRSVTVMMSSTTLYVRPALLQGIEEAARAAGFHVEIGILDSPRQAAADAAVDRLCDPTTGGVVVIALDREGISALHAVPPGIPVVAALEATNRADSQRYPSVVLDDRAAALTATRHLLELGHPTVHHVAIPSPARSSARLQGWRTALRTAAAAVPDPITAGWDPLSGYRAGQRLASDPRATAVLCGNDDLALGVLHALREAGRAVPDDVSVIGFDDIPGAPFFAPPLTTVHLDYLGLGHDCFALLHHQLDTARPRPTPRTTAPSLIVRDTTAAPPATR
jgi:DNA-binding LacI/PurR family transcriptional regulator